MSALIGYPNRADGASLSGGTWSLPLKHVQDDDFSAVARSADTAPASTLIDLDLGSAYPIRLIMLYSPNAYLNAKIRVYADTASDYSSIDYDSGWEMFYPDTFFPASTTYFGEDVSNSQITDELYHAGVRYPYIHVADTAQSYRYWRIAIDDSTNQDGYIDVSRLFVSSVWVPSGGLAGLSAGYELIGGSARTYGGRKRAINHTTYRTSDITLGKMPTDEGMIEALDFIRRVGTAKQFAWVQNENDTTHLQRRSYLATLSEFDDLRMQSVSWVDIRFRVVEELPDLEPATAIQYLYVELAGSRYSVTATPSGDASFVVDAGDDRMRVSTPVNADSYLRYRGGRLIVATAPLLDIAEIGTTSSGSATVTATGAI